MSLFWFTMSKGNSVAMVNVRFWGQGSLKLQTILCESLKSLYVWVIGENGAESIAFSNESLDDDSDVEYHVRKGKLGDVVFCEGVQDFAEVGLTCATRGR